jgi:hypothetical protein
VKDDRKKLMPEILPQPAAAPSATARQRVLRHMKLLIAAGAATTTLAACPYAVVDPLPPPARCRTTGSVLEGLQVAAQPDASGGVVVWVSPSDEEYGEVRFLRVFDLTGATEGTIHLQQDPAEIHLKPDSPDATIEFKLAVECEGAPANMLRITLRPASPDAGTDAGTSPYTVTVTETGTDGGP